MTLRLGITSEKITCPLVGTVPRHVVPWRVAESDDVTLAGGRVDGLDTKGSIGLKERFNRHLRPGGHKD